jgi:hypothetical protein
MQRENNHQRTSRRKTGSKCQRRMATKTVITHEVCRLQRLEGAIIFNDAKACFDLVIECFSNITCMREGLPRTIAQLHSQTLATAKYYLKTSHGIAPKANGHMQPDPFLGTGQGAGDSMARWGFVSDAIIRTYNRQAKSEPIYSPISPVFSNEHIQAFVDDTHGTMISKSNDHTDIIAMIQHNMQTWERILFASGGKLELSKCRFCVIQWKCSEEGTYSLLPSTQETITVTDSETFQPSMTSALKHDEAYKLLGVMMAFDGNTTAQESTLRAKCNKLATAFNQLQLTSSEALQGYTDPFSFLQRGMDYRQQIFHGRQCKKFNKQSPTLSSLRWALTDIWQDPSSLHLSTLVV